MFELHPESKAALDDFCDGLSDYQADYLREVVNRICQDPSGRREPQHRWTRPFRNPGAYVRVPKGVKVWELKTNLYRALFITDTFTTKKGEKKQILTFLPVGGERFLHVNDAPWPH